MALTNLILTVAGVSAAFLLMWKEVKQSVKFFRNNICQIRHWLEEESGSASKAAEKVKPREVESQTLQKDIPKEDKH